MYNFDVAGLRKYLVAVNTDANTAAKDETNSYNLYNYYLARAHLSADIITRLDTCYFYIKDPKIIPIQRKDKDVPK